MRRQNHSPTPKSKSASKHRVKKQPKNRDKKFNPLEYLNSLLVEIQESTPHTARKRSGHTTRRELNSAMAYTTPQTDRTAGISTKSRIRSAYSHRRKTTTTTLKEVLKVDLEKAIT